MRSIYLYSVDRYADFSTFTVMEIFICGLFDIGHRESRGWVGYWHSEMNLVACTISICPTTSFFVLELASVEVLRTHG